MRVLITNNSLAERAGSELYVRDVATALLVRGHRPVAFSTRLGAVAEDLRRASVPVVSDLANLAEPPDVIHGQHHLETMMALLHFPGVPAVFFCHGFLPWEEAPPRFPRVLRYVAVDETCRERLVAEWGIPPERVDVILNFVDLARFRPRGPLPARPRRALVFGNTAAEDTQLPAIREACARMGLALDVAGEASGRVVERPEEMLPSYDLVFAKARAALEALAVGTAVVVSDCVHGLAGLVTSANLEGLRRLNFGLRSLRRRLDVEAVASEIARYDAEDAARVSRWVRAQAGLGPAVDLIEGVYRQVLDAPRPPAEGELGAAARYLQWLGPGVRASNLWQERDALAARVRGLEADLEGASDARVRLAAEEAQSRSRGERLREELERRTAELADLRAVLQTREQTRTWRLRERILAWRGLRRLYRALRGLPAEATPARPPSVPEAISR